MISVFGDDELDVMELPNGMTIKMDFTTKSDKDRNSWGWRGRITGEYRRIRLYDKDDNLISELIEENPLYCPPMPDDLIKHHTDPKVIY